MNYLFPIEMSKRELDSRIVIAANILNLKEDSKIFIYYYKNLNQVLKFNNNKESVILQNGPSYYDKFSYLRLHAQKTCNICKDVLVWDKRVKYYIETTWYLTAPKNCYCKECWMKQIKNLSFVKDAISGNDDEKGNNEITQEIVKVL